MKKYRITFVVVLLLFLLSSCNAQSATETEKSLCVATWNVQNLFDAGYDGTEYEEYTPSSGWTQSAYEGRIASLRRVLNELPPSRDYILVLNEVEGSNVVEDLIKSRDLIKLGLYYYACTEEAWSPIQIAVAASIPITSAHVHSVGEDLRPVLDDAVDELNRCVQMFPDSADAYAARAAYETQQEQYDVALYDWDEALRLNPKSAELAVSKVDVLLRLGRKKEARETLDEALKQGTARAALREWYDKCK